MKYFKYPFQTFQTLLRCLLIILDNLIDIRPLLLNIIIGVLLFVLLLVILLPLIIIILVSAFIFDIVLFIKNIISSLLALIVMIITTIIAYIISSPFSFWILFSWIIKTIIAYIIILSAFNIILFIIGLFVQFNHSFLSRIEENRGRPVKILIFSGFYYSTGFIFYQLFFFFYIYRKSQLLSKHDKIRILKATGNYYEEAAVQRTTIMSVLEQTSLNKMSIALFLGLLEVTREGGLIDRNTESMINEVLRKAHLATDLKHGCSFERRRKRMQQMLSNLSKM